VRPALAPSGSGAWTRAALVSPRNAVVSPRLTADADAADRELLGVLEAALADLDDAGRG